MQMIIIHWWISICTSLLTAPKPLLIDLNPHNKYRIYKPPLIFYTRCTQVYIQQSSPEKRSEDQLCGSDAGNATILEIVVKLAIHNSFREYSKRWASIHFQSVLSSKLYLVFVQCTLYYNNDDEDLSRDSKPLTFSHSTVNHYFT